MRLIDADRALEIVRDQAIAHPNAYYLTTYATLTLRESPTIDAVPVVRCRECKRWERHTEVNRDYGGCRRYSSTMRYDDFCSYGERKEGAD